MNRPVSITLLDWEWVYLMAWIDAMIDPEKLPEPLRVVRRGITEEIRRSNGSQRL
jgi:hypothetical protein